MKYIPLFALSFLLLSSCDNNTVFKVKKDFDNNTWVYRNPLKTDFPINDYNIAYDIVLNLEHNVEYPFQNIYLRITDNFTGKENIDTININCYDRQGFARGVKSGNKYKLSTILRKSYKFPKAKKYFIKIEQFTRKDSLEGISKIEFFVKRSK